MIFYHINWYRISSINRIIQDFDMIQKRPWVMGLQDGIPCSNSKSLHPKKWGVSNHHFHPLKNEFFEVPGFFFAPWKINGWNLRMDPWKRKIFQTIIFRFYVNLQGSIHPWFVNPPVCFIQTLPFPPCCGSLLFPHPNLIHQRNFSKTLIVSSLFKKKKQSRPPTISKQNQDLQHKVLHLQSLLDSTHLAPLLPTSKIAPLKYHAPPDLLWVSWHSRMVTYFVAFVVEGLEAKSRSTTLGDDWTPPSWHSRNWHRLRLGEVFREKKKSHDLWKRCFLFFLLGWESWWLVFFHKEHVSFKGTHLEA